MAQVVMAYTFADVDSGEEIVTKVAGQGLDPGDKAPYKAMTGALAAPAPVVPVGHRRRPGRRTDR